MPGWKKIYVFISSTFNDMHGERDFLVKRVFPQLQEWCESRKLRLIDIDLRWGVTEQDALYNGNVVRVCLNRIDDCRPFFLCFLGQRRGWVPQKEDVSDETLKLFPELDTYLGAASITEMEIIHALIRPMHGRGWFRQMWDKLRGQRKGDKFYERARYAFFYLRDPSYLSQLPTSPPQLRLAYTNEGIENPKERQRHDQALKRWRERDIPKVARDFHRPVRNYQATWQNSSTTPELRMPLQCPSSEHAGIARWTREWQKAGVLDPAETSILNLEEDPSKADEATRFNEQLCKGRLSDFRCQGVDLNEIIFDDLKEAIRQRFPEQMAPSSESGLQKEIDQQEQFVFINSEEFIERAGDFTELDAYVEKDSDRVLALTAFAGMGKSMLLCNWLERYRVRVQNLPGCSVHFRFIGASDSSTNIQNLLRSLLSEVKVLSGKMDEDIPEDPQKLLSVFPNLLEAIGRKGKTIFLFDGLNQLESGLSEMKWLPIRLPANIKIIISYKRDAAGADEFTKQLSDGNATFVRLQPFDNLEDRSRLVQAYLSQYLKQLDDRHLETVIRSQGALSPLYLKVVLSELRVFGAFVNLAEKIRNDFGDTPVSAFSAVLKRLETDPVYSPFRPADVGPVIFSLLAHSRNGLTAAELAETLLIALGEKINDTSRKMAEDTVQIFLRQIRPFLARRNNRYDFFYESFKMAVEHRYVAKSSEEKLPKRTERQWHSILSEYFWNLPTWELSKPMERKLVELPYQLTREQNWERLEKILCDLDFIAAKNTGGMLSDLSLDYQRALESWPDFSFEDPFEKIIASEPDPWMHESVKALLEGRADPYPDAGAGPVLKILQSLSDEERFPGERVAYQFQGKTQYTPPVANAPIYEQGERITGFVCADAVRFCVEEMRATEKSGQSREAVAVTGADRVYRFYSWLNSSRHILSTLPQETLTEARNHASGGVVAKEGDRLLQNSTRIWLARDPRPGPLPEQPSCLQILDHGIVRSLAITPDGSILLSGDHEGSIRVWKPKEGKLLRELKGHKSGVNALAISSDGAIAISGDAGGVICVWQVATGILAKQFGSQASPIVSLALSGDGILAISSVGKDYYVAGECSLRVWNVSTGECIRELGKQQSRANEAILTTDAKLAVTVRGQPGGHTDSTHEVWDVASGKCLLTLPGHPNGTGQVAISSDGKYIVSAPEGPYNLQLHFWDITSRQRLRIFGEHTGPINDIFISADGTVVFSVSEDKTLRVWDAITGECIRIISGHGSGIRCVVGTQDARLAVTASYDATIRIWNLASGSTQKMLEAHSGEVTAIEAVADGKIITAGRDKCIRIWEIATGAYPQKIPTETEPGKILQTSHDLVFCSGDPLQVVFLKQNKTEKVAAAAKVISMAASPDGKAIATGSDDNFIRFFDASTGKVLAQLSGHTGDFQGTITEYNEAVSLWMGQSDAIERAVQKANSQAWGVRALAFSPDGAFLYSGGGDGAFKIWDLKKKLCVHSVTAHAQPINGLKLTRDGARIISYGRDSIARVWEIRTATMLFEFSGHSEEIVDLTITQDGTRAISAGDKTLRAWDTESGKEFAVLQHPANVLSVAIFTNGTLAACACADQILTIWDFTKNECVAKYHSHAPITTKIFILEPNRIAFGTKDGQLHLLQFM